MQIRAGLKGCEHMFRTQILANYWSLRPFWLKMFIMFLVGVIAGLGQAPFNLPVLTLMSFALILWLVHEPKQKFNFTLGWIFGCGYFGISLAWIVQPFFVDIWSTGWMAPFALSLMSMLLGLFWAVALSTARGLYPLFSCVLICLAEISRTYFFSGFPWALIGYIWVDTPLYQLAAFVGPHGMTLATLLLSSCLAFFPWRYRAVLVFCVLILPLFPEIKGPIASDASAVVRLVHPNVEQTQKWDPEFQEEIFQRHLEFSRSEPFVDLIVWPETSVYSPIETVKKEISTAANGAHVVVGYQRRLENNLIYNTLGVLSPDGVLRSQYDKNRLVPFGEYVPFGELLKKVGIKNFAISDGHGFSKGPGPEIFSVNRIGKIQPLICYEGIFPQFVGRAKFRPDLLILITNDAWFGSHQGIAQHFFQARARTIELGLPMVRVANRGISTVIDASGAFGNFLSIQDEGYLDISIPPKRSPTFYFQYGELIIFVTLCFLICVGSLYNFSKRRLTRS